MTAGLGGGRGGSVDGVKRGGNFSVERSGGRGGSVDGVKRGGNFSVERSGGRGGSVEGVKRGGNFSVERGGGREGTVDFVIRVLTRGRGDRLVRILEGVLGRVGIVTVFAGRTGIGTVARVFSTVWRCVRSGGLVCGLRRGGVTRADVEPRVVMLTRGRGDRLVRILEGVLGRVGNVTVFAGRTGIDTVARVISAVWRCVRSGGSVFGGRVWRDVEEGVVTPADVVPRVGGVTLLNVALVC